MWYPVKKFERYNITGEVIFVYFTEFRNPRSDLKIQNFYSICKCIDRIYNIYVPQNIFLV